jgi:hypothetical protein
MHNLAMLPAMIAQYFAFILGINHSQILHMLHILLFGSYTQVTRTGLSEHFQVCDQWLAGMDISVLTQF